MSLLHGLESSHLDLPSGRVRLLSAGQGPTVLLVHGWPAQALLWRHVMRALAPTHRVIAPDLPASGETRMHPGADLTLPGYARLFDELMDALHVTETGLCVHDAGGPIGLHWATRWSGRIDRLCMLNTLVFPELSWAASLFFRSMGSSIAIPMLVRPAMIRAGFRMGVRSGTMDPSALDAYADPFRDVDHRTRFAEAVRAFDATMLHDLPEALDGIAGVPLRLLYGAKDLILPDIAHTMHRLTDRYPHAELSVWPDLGHFVQEDAPDRVATAVAAFFQGSDEQVIA